MKNLIKTLSVMLILIATCLSLVACDGGVTETTKSGLTLKKFKGDDFYTVVDYVAEEGDEVLDLGAFNADGVVIGRIKTGAFDGNQSIKELVIPSTVTEMDKGALRGMKGLAKLTVPFVGASKLADAYYNQTPASPDKAVDGERNFAYIFGSDAYEGGAVVACNYGVTSDVSYYIPATLRQVTVKAEGEYQIPMYAFNGLTQITKVVLEGNITAIGEYAFEGFATLKSINIPATVKNIYANAFNGCAKLDEEGLKIDAGCAFDLIGEKAFIGTALTKLDLNVKEIGESAFAKLGLTEVKIAGATKIGAYAFYNCESLTTATINEGAEISATAFIGTNV